MDESGLTDKVLRATATSAAEWLDVRKKFESCRDLWFETSRSQLSTDKTIGTDLHEVIERCGTLCESRLADQVADFLHRGHKELRHRASAALGKIGDRRFAPNLETALDEPESIVRVAAAMALSRLGEERVGDFVILAAAESQWDFEEGLLELVQRFQLPRSR